MKKNDPNDFVGLQTKRIIICINNMLDRGVVRSTAEVMKKCGYTQSYTTDVRNKGISYSHKFIMTFCKVYNVNERYLETGEEPMFMGNHPVETNPNATITENDVAETQTIHQPNEASIVEKLINMLVNKESKIAMLEDRIKDLEQQLKSLRGY